MGWIVSIVAIPNAIFSMVQTYKVDDIKFQSIFVQEVLLKIFVIIILTILI